MARTFEPIASTTLTGSASSLTVNISSTAYTDLRVIATGLTIASGGSYVIDINAGAISINNRGITGSNNTNTVFYQSTLYGSNTMSTRTDTYATFIFDCLQYNGGGNYKQVVVGRTSGVVTSAGSSNVAFYGGNATSTVAFTSIRFRDWTGGTLAAGTTLTILGIKAA
jgi:hypothetical protein